MRSLTHESTFRWGSTTPCSMCRGQSVAQIHQLLLFEGRQTALERVTSKAERRVVDLAAAFLGEESADIAYTHPGMCLTVLPHRATTPDEVWSRSNASASLDVHPLRDAAGFYRGVTLRAQGATDAAVPAE